MSEEQKNWKVWFDEATNTIHHWSKGKNDKEVAEESIEAMKKLFMEHPDIIGILVDVSEVSTANGQARRAFADFVKTINTKVAFYGANQILRAVIRLVFGASGKTDKVMIVKTEEEALNWVKTKNAKT